jgi:hypothetical protein
MATIDLGSGPVYLLIERDDEGIQVRRMVYAHWQFSADLTAAHPLQRCLQHADEHTHAVLADHLARGRFIGFEIGAQRSPSHSGEDA